MNRIVTVCHIVRKSPDQHEPQQAESGHLIQMFAKMKPYHFLFRRNKVAVMH
jgi:hypothetical protein